MCCAIKCLIGIVVIAIVLVIALILILVFTRKADGCSLLSTSCCSPTLVEDRIENRFYCGTDTTSILPGDVATRYPGLTNFHPKGNQLGKAQCTLQSNNERPADFWKLCAFSGATIPDQNKYCYHVCNGEFDKADW